MVSKHDTAYTYLPESVKAFPQGKEFMGIMEQAGFSQITEQKLTLGIATLYTGNKTDAVIKNLGKESNYSFIDQASDAIIHEVRNTKFT